MSRVTIHFCAIAVFLLSFSYRLTRETTLKYFSSKAHAYTANL